jgi:dihydrofolate reductase
MRKLIVSMNLSLDGYLSGPYCELDWHFKTWSSEMAECLYMELDQADTIIFGRKTYEAMARYWPSKAMDPYCPREDIVFTEMMNNYSKIVFSNSLTSANWNNSRLVHGKIETEIGDLKNRPGKNLMIYGSGKLVSGLMNAELIDEYQLWMHPVLIGKGKSLFGMLCKQLNLELFKSRRFDSGVVLLYYKTFREVNSAACPASCGG